MRGGGADDGDVVGRHTLVDQPGTLADDVANLFVGVGARDHPRSIRCVEDRRRVAANSAQLCGQGGVGRRRGDGDDPAPGLAGQALQERDLRRMEGIGDHQDRGQPGQGLIIDSIEGGQCGALVAHVDGDETLPRPHDHFHQRSADR